MSSFLDKARSLRDRGVVRSRMYGGGRGDFSCVLLCVAFALSCLLTGLRATRSEGEKEQADGMPQRDVAQENPGPLHPKTAFRMQELDRDFQQRLLGFLPLEDYLSMRQSTKGQKDIQPSPSTKPGMTEQERRHKLAADWMSVRINTILTAEANEEEVMKGIKGQDERARVRAIRVGEATSGRLLKKLFDEDLGRPGDESYEEVMKTCRNDLVRDKRLSAAVWKECADAIVAEGDFAEKLKAISNIAATVGSVEVIGEIISSLEGAQVEANSVVDFKEMFSVASKNGHVEVVKLLLEWKEKEPAWGIDPAADDNYLIKWASENGHFEVVELLLGAKGVDPAVDRNYAIKWASARGHTAVVKLLLAAKGVDPGAGYNLAIRAASLNGHVEVVKLLLGHGGVDPGADDNCAIKVASRNGHVEVVKVLLAAEGVNPAVDDNYAIRWASSNGHVEVVKVLLQWKKGHPTCGIDPAAVNIAELERKAPKDGVDEVKLLVADLALN